MGASFYGVALAAHVGSLRQELVDGLERAKALTPRDTDDMEWDVFSEDMVCQDIVDAFEETIDIYDKGTTALTFTAGPVEVMFTGGMSWGDPPTEAFEHMQTVVLSGLFRGLRLPPETEEYLEVLQKRASDSPETTGSLRDLVMTLAHVDITGTINGDASRLLEWLANREREKDSLRRLLESKVPALVEEEDEDE